MTTLPSKEEPPKEVKDQKDPKTSLEQFKAELNVPKDTR